MQIFICEKEFVMYKRYIHMEHIFPGTDVDVKKIVKKASDFCSHAAFDICM